MKNVKKIYAAGQALMVLGSALYLVELLAYESWAMTLGILFIYAVAAALMLVGWVGNREERRAEREQKRRQRAQEAQK